MVVWEGKRSTTSRNDLRRVWASPRATGIRSSNGASAPERGVAVQAAVVDVGDAESTAKGFAEIEGRSDIWAVVNNAGFAQAGAIEDVDDDAVRYQLEVNVVAPARVARLVLPGMRSRGEGRIVNMSSLAGRVSLPLMGWYCAGKHALAAMTDAGANRTFSKDHRPSGDAKTSEEPTVAIFVCQRRQGIVAPRRIEEESRQ